MDNNGMQNDIQNNYQNGIQNGEQLEAPLSMGEWIITLILMAIPCVNIVMMFVWGFGQGNISRRNYCRAMLIMTAIGIVLGVILYGTIAAAIIGSLGAYAK